MYSRYTKGTECDLLCRNHESFTSYRYGLFHVLEYKFVLGTDYIAEEPRSANRAQTLPDLPKPRMFYIAVTKFNYISSKGEGNFASHTRKFEELTRKWQIDIELDEEKKRNLVLQTTASQTVSLWRFLLCTMLQILIIAILSPACARCTSKLGRNTSRSRYHTCKA